jgi:hypothetical protein
MAAVGGAAALLASARKERFRQQARAKALASRRDVLLSAGLQKRRLSEQFSDSDSGAEDEPPLTGWAAMMKRVPSEERKAREDEERLARGEEDTVGSLRIMSHGPGACFCLVLH